MERNNRKKSESNRNTFFRKCSCESFDHSLEDAIPVDVTAISTPLDRVPLYTVPVANEQIILLKSSQAASSSDLLSFGTPESHVLEAELREISSNPSSKINRIKEFYISGVD